MTDLDDSLPAPQPPPSRRWLAIIVAVLLGAFATVAAVQWRQLTLLDAGVHYEGDNIVWSFFQLEAEYLKLRNTLRDIDRDPASFDREALQTRYDIFVSRVELVEPERTVAHMETRPIQADTVTQLRAFVAAADQWLGPSAPPIDLAGVRAVLERMTPLAEPVHDMAMWANDTMAAQIGARNALVREQNRIAIALTVFQSLLTIGFAVIVVRQLRALEQRGAALERLAARLQEARRGAEAASHTKSAFLANMSHELRTPFQGVLGMIALAEDGPLTEPQAEQLRTARESARHLLALLNDVLDVSTLENGQLRLVPAPTALHELLADIEALMDGPARAKGIVLRMRRDGDVPAYVRADATRLKQILFNLVGNAVKFTDSGTVLLETFVEDDLAWPAALCFRISDTGIGMDAATIGRLFQRFVQGDDSSSRRFGGTGLGLEISRSLARMMGGDIAVQSTPGQGSSFSLRVPLVSCEAPSAAELAATAPAAPDDTPPLRVLVAEDHPVNREFLRVLLGRLGHQVTLRENGQLAVEAAAQGDYDLVLMDLHMPVLDGLAAAQAIRALPAPRGDVLMVALTADAYTDTRQRAAQAGMNDFLTKPVQPVELQRSLARLFGRARSADWAPASAPDSRAAASKAAGPADAAPWLDTSAPELMFEGLPPGTHAQLLAVFFDDESGSIARLSGLLNAPAGADLRNAAHAVRGAALSLGLRRLAATAASIEALADASGDAAVAVLRKRFHDDWVETHTACITAGWIERSLVRTEAA